MSGAANEWIDKAKQIAADVLATHSTDVDASARWPHESIAALSKNGFLGLIAPVEFGGAGQRPSTFAQVVCSFAEQCASTAMIYLMHVCGMRVIAEATSFGDAMWTLASRRYSQHVRTAA